MKVSISWLKELVDYKLTAQELADKLSLTSIGVNQLTENYLELDLTYNRGDLLSLRGVAREIAAVTGSKLLFSSPNLPDRDLPKTPIEIKDKQYSLVQCVTKIEGLKVGPSNPNWVKKLTDSGMRSVNNLVDVTNLLMLEFGQPFHAFDAYKVRDETIIVRAADKDEQIITLDNKLRNLTPQDIVLADTKGAIDVAGIMGGKDTEVTESTKIILLSASLFNPVMLRGTSKRLGLYSEASKRFLHGLTKKNLLQALASAIKMYQDLGGKLTALNLVGDLEDKPKKITLTQKRINSLLGIKIGPELVEEYLKKLGFSLATQGLALRAWEVTVPYWRLDIEIEEDLIEEVARMYGYDKIAGQPLKEEIAQKLNQSFYNFIYDLKVSLKDTGLTEVQTYSFYSTDIINALGLDNQKEKLVKVANPISSETEYLRQNIWPNLLEVIGRNLRKGYKDIGIFEIGKAFNIGSDGKPTENYRLAIALSNETNNPFEELVSIKKELGLTDALVFEEGLFHPKRQAGNLAEVHLRVLNKLGMEKRVAVLEIELESHGNPD